MPVAFRTRELCDCSAQCPSSNQVKTGTCEGPLGPMTHLSCPARSPDSFSSRFPGGTVYLTPDPASPFRQLTHELFRRFPENPPYGGAFGDVVPHLSIPLLPDEDLEDVERELADRLPVGSQAREACLYWWEPGACGTLETFPFGTTAA